MATRILWAPPCLGKTEFVLRGLQEAAKRFTGEPWVILARDAQVRAFEMRLASMGGAMGAVIMDFGMLYDRICSSGSADCVLLPEPVRYRLLRMVIDELVAEKQISFYASLQHRPGFADLLVGMIGELKQGMIDADDLLSVLSCYEASGPRLEELTLIYRRYEQRLEDRHWGDRESMGQRALMVLQDEQDAVKVGSPIWVDGFDQFDTVQLNLLCELAKQTDDLTITLTGDIESRSVHTRLAQTRQRLEAALGVQAVSLGETNDGMSPTLRYLERRLYRPGHEDTPSADRITMIDVPSRAIEARESLRWAKSRIVYDEIAPDHIAVMANRIDPYQAHLLQIAQEYGLPLRLSSHLPLAGNALVVTILNLLSLVRRVDGSGDHAFERRRVIEAWQSPYFDWGRALGEYLCITPTDAQSLDTLSRDRLVIHGETQWRQALVIPEESTESPLVGREDDEHERAQSVGARELAPKFEAFVSFFLPPETGSCDEYAGWIISKLGLAQGDGSSEATLDPSLNLLAQIDEDEEWGRVDRAALQALVNAMQGLVWSEQGLGLRESLTYEQFLDELLDVVQSATFAYPLRRDEPGIWVGDVSEMRGLNFDAVAILGLSEGEFPSTESDDPLLRDADRVFLQDQGLSIDRRFMGDERDRFYEALTRSRRHLLLSRSFLSDNGSDWPASIHWRETLRLLPVEPERITGQDHLYAEGIASSVELMQWLAAHEASVPVIPPESMPEDWSVIECGTDLLTVRQQAMPTSALDGNLTQWEGVFSDKLGPDYVWSASRLESYRACPFRFFVGSVLGLEPRVRPQEGFDVAQRGSILHEIMEKLFRQAGADLDEQKLLDLIPSIADEVLATAPAGLGFRETPWWEATCDELVDLVQHNISALCDPDFAAGWYPWKFEARFGIRSSDGDPNPVLVIDDGQEGIRVRGLIDRLDRNDQGDVRVIDYKSSSSGGRDYGKSALERGKKLQLSIYALAARDALHLGDPVEGLYWHLCDAKPSSVSLAKVGMERAFELVRLHVLEATIGARSGQFVPQVPDGGCPEWCSAASFCWRNKEGYR